MANTKLITILAGAVVSFPALGKAQGGLIHEVRRATLAVSPDQGTAYTVKSGENLWRIARDHGFTEQQLMDYNRMPNSVIRAGQVIRMPGKAGQRSGAGQATAAPASQPAASGTAAAGSYTVKSGDVLSAIAKAHGVSAQALMTTNGIKDPAKLQIGQSLKIPGGGSGAVAAAAPTAPAAPMETRPAAAPASGAAAHTVRKGDTLFQIASLHKVSIAQIKAANNLTTEELRIGQSLAIPGSAAPAAGGQVVPTSATGGTQPKVSDLGNYTVQKGDSYSKIARQFGTTVDELIRINQISNPNVLVAGQNLLVPGGTKVAATTPGVPGLGAADSALATGPQGTPPAIGGAVPAEMAPAALPDPLPVRSGGVQDYAGYTIVPGDTLDTISQTFATTKAELMRLNKLSSPDEVKSGDQILVPTYGIYNDLGGPY